MGLIVSVLEEKKRIVEELKQRLSEDSKLRSERDHHAHRKPRPCGMTIHTGIGCSYVCAYCYIYDMGFPAKVKPYPLSPQELVYALALNPYVVPRYTFAAYGSVTEPFLPETRELAIEYLREVYRWLKLPSQVSTKSVIDEELAKKLCLTDPNLNVLITVVTISRYRELEGRAPSPIERLNGAEIALKYGLKVTLFMRPIIPGVTDREAVEILKLSIEKGIDTVVLGTLRVTPGILERLKGRGVDIDAIEKRLPRYPRSRSDQVTIRGSDIKKKIEGIAKDMGFKVFDTACAANVYAHGEFCNACDFGPCGDPRNAPRVSYSDVVEYLEYLGLRYRDVEVDSEKVKITVKNLYIDLDTVRYTLTFTTRRKVLLKVM